MWITTYLTENELKAAIIICGKQKMKGGKQNNKRKLQKVIHLSTAYHTLSFSFFLNKKIRI